MSSATFRMCSPFTGHRTHRPSPSRVGATDASYRWLGRCPSCCPLGGSRAPPVTGSSAHWRTTGWLSSSSFWTGNGLGRDQRRWPKAVPRCPTASIEEIQDPYEGLQECGRRYRSLALANPMWYQIIFQKAPPGFEPSEQAFEVAVKAFGTLVNAVRRGIATGVIAEGPLTDIAQLPRTRLGRRG